MTTSKIQVVVPSDRKDLLDQIAKDTNKSRTEVVNLLLDRGLNPGAQGSYVVTTTSNVASMVESIYKELYAELRSKGYASADEIATAIIKNGVALALHSIESDSQVVLPTAPKRVGFRPDV